MAEPLIIRGPASFTERLTFRGAGVSLTVLAGVTFAGATSAVVAHDPHLLRIVAAVAASLALVSVALWRPSAAIQATVVFLVGLAFLRRLLIGTSGWSSLDPLLLVGPVVVTFIAARLFLLGGRPVAPDRISRLVLVVLVVALVEVPNPLGGGVAAGAGGLLLLGVPLLWFFVGRELVTDNLARNLLILAVALAVVDALYGLLQTQVGFPSWDLAWFDITGYSSLNIGHSIRAFGTFASAQEYALFLGAGLAIAAAFVAQRRYLALLPVPLLAVALFLASGRGALITSVFAVVVVFAIVARRARMAATVVVIAVLAAYGGLRLAGSGQSSGNSLVSHQVSGLTNPLDPNHSTLLTHLTLLRQGITYGLTHPLGQGPGATNQGGGKLNGGQGGNVATEVDISNSFVGLGLIGGIAFLGLVIAVLIRAFRGWFAGNALMLPVIGVLVVCLGQWWEGGLYALGPLIWLMIGWVARSTTAEPSAGEAHPAHGNLISNRRGMTPKIDTEQASSLQRDYYREAAQDYDAMHPRDEHLTALQHVARFLRRLSGVS